MEVLLQVVYSGASAVQNLPAQFKSDGCSPSPRSPLTIENESQEELRAASHPPSETTWTIGCLRLSHASSAPDTTHGRSQRHESWCVSALHSPSLDNETSTVDADADTADEKSRTSSSRIQLRPSYLALSTPAGRPLPLPPQFPQSSTSLHAALCAKMRQLIARVEALPVERRPREGPPLSSCVFFCGSDVATRKDALYLTSLHRLLVECLQHAPRARADLSLITCYELWGCGDVLAAEGCVSAKPDSVTWYPVASLTARQEEKRPSETSPSTGNDSQQPQLQPPSTVQPKVDVSTQVQKQLREWFARIDNASALWSQASPRATPLTAADKLAYLESNVVICTLRFSNSSSERRGYLPLVLLPNSHVVAPPPSSTSLSPSFSPHHTRAVLWREFEALRTFMQTLPRTHRHHTDSLTEAPFAATTAATLHAAALRRSRWLSTLARFTSPPRSEWALQHFGRKHTARHFTWVGCLSADGAQDRATRTTLALLDRLTARTHQLSPTHLPRRRQEKAAALDAAESNPQETSECETHRTTQEEATLLLLSASSSSPSLPPPPPSSDVLLSPRPSTQAPQPHQRSHSPPHAALHVRDTEEKPSESPQGSEVLSDAQFENGASQSSSFTSVLAGVVERENDLATKSSAATSVSELTALVASLRLYNSTLEDEVSRLRQRLARYESCEGDEAQKRTESCRRVTCGDRVHEKVETPAAMGGQQTALGQRVLSANLDFSKEKTVEPTQHSVLPLSVETAKENLGVLPGLSVELQPRLDSLRHLKAGALHAAQGHSAQRSTLTDYVAQLELKVALYEQRLAIVDHYVTPTLTRCADEIDHVLQPRLKAQSRRP